MGNPQENPIEHENILGKSMEKIPYLNDFEWIWW